MIQRSSWEANGINVTIKDSKIINSTYDIIAINKNSKNIVIDGLEVDPLHKDKWFVINYQSQINVKNVTVMNSKIIINHDKLDNEIFKFYHTSDLKLENNIIVRNDSISQTPTTH